MKSSLFLKLFFVLPLIVFVDYLFMVIIGCTTCYLGFGEDFYGGTFFITGKIILALSILLFGYFVYPDIIAIFKLKRNGASA